MHRLHEIVCVYQELERLGLSCFWPVQLSISSALLIFKHTKWNFGVHSAGASEKFSFWLVMITILPPYLLRPLALY